MAILLIVAIIIGVVFFDDRSAKANRDSSTETYQPWEPSYRSKR